ncbi:carbonic anhydrase [Lutimonas zeaxanthinifaciens]|uniref:carbonic anhydrase n=1 Tax=Lutimonas zeaxanthinifaciens TaxID=3060215 RepID=UPI00265CB75A|nr:carbonic anhydrase family protein [Lutimonas sp. YSD2104]WKK66661.1 carbonic anhydrase family protein [Lutimonas sp. YSD2104]
MKSLLKIGFAVLLFSSLSCNKNEQKKMVKEESHEMEWSYEGETSPEHWAELEKNSDCLGNRQSPINILDINVVEDDNKESVINLHYSPSTILKKVRNNGHSIQFDFDKGDSIAYNKINYNLVQIHFHEPSEHTINGIRYPIEIHLVHQSKEKYYTVLSVFGVEGEKSEAIEEMESFLPLKKGEEREINKAFDLSRIFPENKTYYSYGGSLTTPPCSETVQWVIFKNPIVISLEEVLKLKDNMPLENYRNEQPINNRLVYLHEL